MEQLLPYQMDMDAMASWKRFHLANVPEVPAPVRARDIMEIRRSTPPLFFTSVGRAACSSATVHSLLSAHWKLRSREQHSPKAKSPNTRKGQGSDECKLNEQGGRDAAS